MFWRIVFTTDTHLPHHFLIIRIVNKDSVLKERQCNFVLTVIHGARTKTKDNISANYMRFRRLLKARLFDWDCSAWRWLVLGHRVQIPLLTYLIIVTYRNLFARSAAAATLSDWSPGIDWLRLAWLFSLRLNLWPAYKLMFIREVLNTYRCRDVSKKAGRNWVGWCRASYESG